MNGLTIPVQLLLVYLLFYLRFIGVMMASPLFFAVPAPVPFRFLFAAVLTVASAASLGELNVPTLLLDSWLSLVLLGLRELLIGTLLGLLASLPLWAVQLAGERAGLSMGLSMSAVVDPQTQAQIPLIGELNFLLCLWFYFHWNGHLLMTQALLESVKLVPLAGVSPFPGGDMAIAAWMAGLFSLAVKLALPFYCVLFLADIGLALLARTVPQMNVFIMGLPLKMAVGFFVLAFVLPLSVDLLSDQLEPWIRFALESVLAWR